MLEEGLRYGNGVGDLNGLIWNYCVNNKKIRNILSGLNLSPVTIVFTTITTITMKTEKKNENMHPCGHGATSFTRSV